MTNVNERKLTERIWLEAARIGWIREDARAYVEINFKKKAIALLTESEMMQFIQVLKSLPDFAPVV
ncbi:hypothetical protein [Nostoc sp.]|uniref:hypothetical protein n=1 Tax=Nostoc sp. TaxID=1180 RepID=UPI002FF68B5C